MGFGSSPGWLRRPDTNRWHIRYRTGDRFPGCDGNRPIMVNDLQCLAVTDGVCCARTRDLHVQGSARNQQPEREAGEPGG